jgi:prepilin-type N-terminal cleavage/methylation domain-containing protein
MSMNTRRAAGFTMTEMAVTVAIAAILGVIAVPAFNTMIATQRGKTYASALYGTLAKTRSEAITLNGNVTLNPAAGGWGNGWQMNDPNGNPLDNRGASVGVTIAGPNLVTYTPSGRMPAGTVAPVFVISTMSGSTHIYQCVSVDLSGRPYMKAAQAC